MNYPILYKKDTTDFDNLGIAVIKNAKELFVHQVLNGEYTAEFDVPMGDDILSEAEYDDFIKIDSQLFRIRSMSSMRNDDGSSYIHITCYHVWYDACDCKYIHHTFTKSGNAEIDGWINVTPRWVLENVFDGTPFTVGEVEISTPTDIFATKSNPAQIVNMLIENVGGEIYRDNYTIHLKKGGDQYNGKHIVYGKNLKSIEKVMDDSGIITRLYPLGQDDMDISSVNNGISYLDSPIQADYGYIKCGYKSFSNITDPTELLTEAKKLWSTDTSDGIDKPKITYNLQTHDLEDVSIGHTVRVKDSELDIDILTKVTEITTYPLERHRGSIVLSNHRDATVKLSDKILSEVTTLEKIMDNSGNVMSQYIDNVRDKIQSEVNDATSKRLTVHKFGDIWLDDTDHPTKAMVISDGVFAVANSKKPNGDWDWRTIGTADEFMADRINAPWLNAGYIDTDKITIRSSDGKASLSGRCFEITTDQGFEATMSADEGFKYIYRRDQNGNPYDYVIFNHKGQQRYWHGYRIPSTYQFAKGVVTCIADESYISYGIIQLEGPEWKEIARVYNKIVSDQSLTNLQKYTLISQMVKASVAPIRMPDLDYSDGAVILENEIVTKNIGTYPIPQMYEISKSGTLLTHGMSQTNLKYDGAAMLYYGAGGYIRTSGSKNYCYNVEAVYDIAVTLDIDYE